METRIVVLQRGWVVIGNYEEKGDEIVMTNANVIRRWGTTEGLGELVSGPIKGKTILDKAGEVRAHKLAVVMTIKCDLDAWAKVL